MNNSTFGKASVNVPVNNSAGLQTSVLVGCAQSASKFLMKRKKLMSVMVDHMESSKFEDNFR